MAKRGRPRHPDILTQREWEVLALLREGLTNEQIAERLNTTERTARYHVSEILSKLGVSTRQEAAAWQPEERRSRWALLVAPLSFWRHGWAGAAATAAVLVAVGVAAALLSWGLLRTRSDGSAEGALAVGGWNTCVLMHGGVKCWGDNLYGTVGDGTQGLYLYRSVPTQVVGLTSGVSAISAGAVHVCAVTAQGTVKCWGSNSFGQLGNGQGSGGPGDTFRLSKEPLDVVGLTDVVAISAGYFHTCALTSAGGVKCWGSNLSGQVGDGTTTTHNTPVDVAGLTSGVRAISAGGLFTCALMDSGGVKCWGANDHGQLAATSSEQCSLSPPYPPFVPCSTTPLDVVGLASGVTAVVAGPQQHVCAITTGGALKCWGADTSGQLGAHITTKCGQEACSMEPVSVEGLQSGVKAVGLGAGHSCAALSSGGVKCWGSNGSGQLGNGTTVDHAAPAYVVGLKDNVVEIGGGDAYTCVATAASAVKCWGAGDRGQLGDGTNGLGDCSCRTTPFDALANGTAATPAITPAP